MIEFQAIEVKVPFFIMSREDAGSKLPKIEREPEEKTSGPLIHCCHLNNISGVFNDLFWKLSRFWMILRPKHTSQQLTAVMPSMHCVSLRLLSLCRDGSAAYMAVLGLLQTVAFEESSIGATSPLF